MPARRDRLAHYRQKRDFSKTPEPKGIAGRNTGQRYLIQKHDATRLHYDFRLELDGVLKSWAVTRGPSLDPQEKRLAVEVEDHPVSYGSFEGTIPKGQYGGGTVMLWDEGSWEPVGDPHEGMASGKLVFQLHGKRLQGEWILVRMQAREKDKGRNNWLLIKHQDDVARPGDKDALLRKNTISVVSKRSMEKIAAAQDRVWHSKPAAKPAKKKAVSKRKTSRATLPGFIAPQLATLTDAMPQGKNWAHEIKFDGYRALAYIEHGNARLFTRTGLDWTSKFHTVAEALSDLSENAILDGEIIALNGEGASSFKELQNALSEGQGDRLQYYAFDLLHLDGQDLTGQPLSERKRLLQTLIGDSTGGCVFYSKHFIAGKEFLQRACSLQLEGVISKRLDLPYASGRGTSWLKTKCHKRQEFAIGGFTLPAHEARGIGALLLGYYADGKLVYAGKVGTGFDQESSLLLRKKLDTLAQSAMPFAGVASDAKRGAHWVSPKLVCEVEFSEWTADGRLRHPSFQGLREDKPAKSIGRDVPIAALRKTSGSGKDATVGGIRLSHPDRIIYPGTGITKLQLANYYLDVAERILPHIAGRPLSMLRCPEGTGEPCFFQRHIAHDQSPYLHNTGIDVKGRDETYLMINDVKGLLTLVQWGVIELHPWGCLADKPDKPDRIIFDLDPDPAVEWKEMVKGANEVRARMRELGLESFLKTTGGKGLHVEVPLTRGLGWPAVKAFARAIAESMQHDSPDRYIATMSKAARKGKIFVDYLRNELTSTAVAPFSARAREGATAATPLAWDELTATLKPAVFTIETVPARLRTQKADPWAEFFTVRQKISAAHLRALKIEPK